MVPEGLTPFLLQQLTQARLRHEERESMSQHNKHKPVPVRRPEPALEQQHDREPANSAPTGTVSAAANRQTFSETPTLTHQKSQHPHDEELRRIRLPQQKKRSMPS